jgi:hypothetical protein
LRKRGALEQVDNGYAGGDEEDEALLQEWKRMKPSDRQAFKLFKRLKPVNVAGKDGGEKFSFIVNAKCLDATHRSNNQAWISGKFDDEDEDQSGTVVHMN